MGQKLYDHETFLWRLNTAEVKSNPRLLCANTNRLLAPNEKLLPERVLYNGDSDKSAAGESAPSRMATPPHTHKGFRGTTIAIFNVLALLGPYQL
jgi:hypothetical protein